MPDDRRLIACRDLLGMVEDALDGNAPSEAAALLRDVAANAESLADDLEEGRADAE